MKQTINPMDESFNMRSFQETRNQPAQIKQDDTLDFLDKINKIGGGNQKQSMYNNNLDNTKPLDLSIKSSNLAQRVDFDFPAIPEYKGLQEEFLNSKYKSPNGFIRQSTESLHNQTTNTINTINTLNLEKINNRNLDRLERFGIEDTPSKPLDEL